MTELVSNRLLVRANKIFYDTWRRKFVYLVAQGLARAVKIIFVKVWLFHESVGSHDALMGSIDLKLSLRWTTEAEMVTSLKFKITLHVRIVVYVIEDVLRRSASALDF